MVPSIVYDFFLYYLMLTEIESCERCKVAHDKRCDGGDVIDA